MGHWGNWELGGARFSQLPTTVNAIYHPLENEQFDKLFIRMRTRLGNGLYPMKETVKCMLRDRGETTATAFIAYQTLPGQRLLDHLPQPSHARSGNGEDRAKAGPSDIYLGIDRPQRGHYIMRFEVLETEPKNTPEGYISEPIPGGWNRTSASVLPFGLDAPEVEAWPPEEAHRSGLTLHQYASR